MLTEKQQSVLAQLQDKTVGVIGIGLRSGVPLIRFLHSQGCKIVACDRKQRDEMAEVLAALQGIPLELQLGEDYLVGLERCDWLFRTPGMRPDVVQLQQAVAAGARLTSEIELVFALAEAPITGITGSDGKTTTTTLVDEMLRADGRQVFLGGNIGHSLLEDVLQIPATAEIVLELSSFQLMSMDKSPAAALVTNLSPNHLDYHTSMAEYIQAKTNILRWQQEQDIVVLNWDNELTRQLTDIAQGQVYYFSRQEEVEQGAFLRHGQVMLRLENDEIPLCRADEIKLLGEHNLENVMAAAVLASVKGVKKAAVRQVATHFTGVEHRLEFVRELDGVRYYNDSIASSPTRTMAGLAALTYPIILIAGGYDKKIPFAPLAEAIVGRVAALALIGQTAPKIAAAVESECQKKGATIAMQYFDSLQKALQWAKEIGRPGDAVLLSPACASFDMFKDFEQRGQIFKKLVSEL